MYMVYKRRNTVANKAVSKIQRRFRKRYVQRKGGLRFGKLARDVAYLKGALNSETKMVRTLVSAQPRSLVPTLTELVRPDNQGTSSVDRVGYKVKYNHISGKLAITKKNFGDIQANATVIMHVIWLKNGEFKSDFESNFAEWMLNKDQNLAFSPMCYFNKSKYDSWISTQKYTVHLKDEIPLNQVAIGLPTNPGTGDNTDNTLGRAPQEKVHYVNFNKRISVHGEWNNTLSLTGTTSEPTRMIPYLFAYTDCTGSQIPSGTDQPNSLGEDRINIQGTIRLSYKDN